MRESIIKLVPSSDGIHTLSGRVFLPDCEPKGYFHVLHGMTEYAERYSDLMSLMAEHGYIAFGYDHLGHGHTAKDKDELGYIAKKDGWRRLVEDVHIFADSVKAEYGDLPYILMGHSMGSLIARLAAAEYGGYDKLIICGTADPSPTSGTALAVCKAIKRLGGERRRSVILAMMIFGSYNKRYKDGAEGNWITKNLDMLESYKGDEYSGFLFTSSAMVDLVRLNNECSKRVNIEKLSKTAPVLLISGDGDPVGDYGRGVKKVFYMMRDAGVPVKAKLYKDFRHEILHDDFDTVSGDILRFVEG